MSFRGIDPMASLKDLEKQLDAKQDKLSRSQASASPGARPEAVQARAEAISVPLEPAKTTVGFGAGSFTKQHAAASARARSRQTSESSTTSNPKAASPAPTASSSAAADDAAAKKAAKEARRAQYQNKQFTQKPKLTKAERRAQQEQARAAKEAAKSGKGGQKPKQKQKSVKQAQNDKAPPSRRAPSTDQSFFSHLKTVKPNPLLTESLPFGAVPDVHPSIVRLALQISKGLVAGSTDRCVQMLLGFKDLIADYTTPENAILARDLNQNNLKRAIGFLAEARPLCLSMGNAIKALKHFLTHELDPATPEIQAKEELNEFIDRFIEEKIILAHRLIASHAERKIKHGDVILVLGRSRLLLQVLRAAKAKNIDFTVVVVDTRPRFPGRQAVKLLTAAGIECSYIHIGAISYVMRHVSKVFLSAEAMLANGSFSGSIGSSMIAMMAHSLNVPVMLCCETYKFSDRVQTDAFVSNELGDPEELVTVSDGDETKLKDWQSKPNLTLLNLVYDVTPSHLVDMVITEIGMLPCTSGRFAMNAICVANEFRSPSFC
eukprot:TRINITY_DN9316_c0_g1_i4.p1 TRINITY_DN9316_c0_g1~~TRINITY_DN9316_c0_g1_i4.p1  ORF type:complete len:561 (+),score=110.51 TRINITY_DN9316_c0_g1_i4:42-1685(+)